MLRPLPYPDPEQLVSVHPEEIQHDGQVSSAGTVHGGHAQLAGGRRRVLGGSGLGRRPAAALPTARSPSVSRWRTSPRITCRCTASRRSSAGISCARTPNRHSPLVALLGYGYWKSHYRGRRDVIGETVRLDTDIATIVGVLPAWFNATTSVSMPLRIPAKEFSSRGTGRVSVYARLRPDVTIEQARARLSARMVAAPYPDGTDARRTRGARGGHLGARSGHVAVSHHRQRPCRSGRPDPAHRVCERGRPAAGTWCRAAVGAGGAGVARRRDEAG